jgi:lipopolysaccharide/colanic/teichoic acid biosynthesis glycosyltransferase
LSYLLKRVFDLAVASVLLVTLSPLLLGIGLLIRLDSPGRAIFSQTRVGARRRTKPGQIYWDIRTFKCHKFRSMHTDVDQAIHLRFVRAFCRQENRSLPEDGENFKLKNDPRVTRIGRILRKTSLDELPQLLNVLKGEMSLVGPRPVPEYEVAEYNPHHYQRLEALPGITGLWQVRGRGRVTFEEMVQMDIEYTKHSSFLTDLKILLLTVPAVVSGRGAE